MAQIRAIQARGLLGSISRRAKKSAIDLIDAIETEYDLVATESFRAGRIYVTTSGSGQSHSFLIPSTLTSAFGTEKIAEQYVEFQEIYADAVTNGTITDSTAVDADLQTMLSDDRLQTVTEMRNDYTAIRFPGTSFGGL